jgi:hypothetical protein
VEGSLVVMAAYAIPHGRHFVRPAEWPVTMLCTLHQVKTLNTVANPPLGTSAQIASRFHYYS